MRDTYPQIDKDYVQTGKVRYVLLDLPLERIHKDAFKASEAVHGEDDDLKFKSLNWALDRMGYGRVGEVPDDRGEELASLIPEYANQTSDTEVPF